MLRPWALSLVFGLSCFTCVIAASAQGETAPATDLEQPAEAIPSHEVHPSSVRLASRYRKQFIRTPDGAFWDMWGEREYLRVFNSAVKQRAIKETRSVQGWASAKTVGYRWELEESREARAWAVGESVGPSGHLQYWARDFGGMPPLWNSLTSQSISFIYINENDRDVRTTREDLRATRVLTQLDEHLYRVAVDRGRGLEPAQRAAPGRLEKGVLVHIDNPLLTQGGFLNGEFILWPDGSIQPPPGAEEPRYRYIAVESLVPSTEDFIKAVEGGEAEMVTWAYRKTQGAYRWERKAFPIEYRPVKVGESDAEQSLPAAEPKQVAPAVDITHLLVLKNGDWVEGQLISDDGGEIRFLVVVAGIAGERVYSKDLVGRVVEK